jgi:hypothetical protein
MDKTGERARRDDEWGWICWRKWNEEEKVEGGGRVAWRVTPYCTEWSESKDVAQKPCAGRRFGGKGVERSSDVHKNYSDGTEPLVRYFTRALAVRTNIILLGFYYDYYYYYYPC